MKELVTQVSYLYPVRQSRGEPVDEVVANFFCQNPVKKDQTWSGKIEKVSLKIAAEIIFTFFNSQHAQKTTFLEVSINSQKIFIHKSEAAQSADHCLNYLASGFKLE